MVAEELQKSLGYQFKDEKLITEALTHRSYTKDFNNERLEYLGDAVLDLIVGEYLYHLFPDAEEGMLSKLRAALVNEDSFDKLAKKLDLGKYLFLSPAEENNRGREKPSILSSAFEALIGAIYLEAGFDKAKEIALRLIKEVFPKITPEELLKDYKTNLQEITQAHFGVVPEYRLISATGPDHRKEFEIGVFINDKEYARAKGRSKKAAQQEGARLTIEKLKKELNLK
ncbi:ribonuclease III [Caminibacter pacificus]|jgi:ribonuclease-3|uniref:Ribonuclease 3 n=1 Tax=Caminibacter pacificus TaxID=1424653 RepID=A0AAJ4UXC3_9BACT|nr:ribonuclease III [Caminibacter pacificus]NPA87891.1 ribonuclease III [Campylobacterota bacterium]QCI27489.1 ribonuclease III [Caminibacter pacificus]ROR38928.1 ribonuclease-3 [Caminibacter pacificus]